MNKFAVALVTVMVASTKASRLMSHTAHDLASDPFGEHHHHHHG